MDESDNLVDRFVSDTLRFDTISNSPITSVSGIYRGMKKAGITVSMDGHGVDEMLYGYRDMLYKLYYHYYREGNSSKCKELKDIIIPTYDESGRANAAQNLNIMEQLADSRIKRLKNKIGRFLRGQKTNNIDFTIHPDMQLLGDNYDFSGCSYPDQVLLNETFVNSLPTIFRDFDRSGMMNSVEIRMPFMDWRIVTYLFSLPVESKIGNGFNKLIVREAMKGRMAEAIRTRKHKIGIGSPVEKWVKDDMKEWILDQFHSQSFRESPITVGRNFKEILMKQYKNESLNLKDCQKIWMEINLQLLK